jgi:ribonuclease HII
VTELNPNDYELIVGFDEVGYGAFAGPLVVGMAVYKPNFSHELVKDSKKFSSSRSLSKGVDVVKRTTEFYATSFTHYNNNSGTLLANIDYMIRELFSAFIVTVMGAIQLSKVAVIVDGDRETTLLSPQHHVHAIPKADSFIPAVSAASMIAKKARDDFMINIASNYPPEFDFVNNKGYGTPRHREALKKFGALDIHRRYIHDVSEVEKTIGKWDGKRFK